MAGLFRSDPLKAPGVIQAHLARTVSQLSLPQPHRAGAAVPVASPFHPLPGIALPCAPPSLDTVCITRAASRMFQLKPCNNRDAAALAVSVKPDPRSGKLLPSLPHPIGRFQPPEETESAQKGTLALLPRHTVLQSARGKEGERRTALGSPRVGWGGSRA